MRKLLYILLFLSTASFSQGVYRGRPLQRQFISEGDSYSNLKAGTTAPNTADYNGYYLVQSIYDSIRATRTLAFTSLALSGRKMSEINTAKSTAIIPYLRYNDVVFLEAGSNDIGTDSAYALTVYNNLTSYSTSVRATGAKLVLCTIIARDYNGTDPAYVMTRIDSVNALIRTNQASICDALCDIAANSNFDQKSDTSNTTYYETDKAHPKTAGWNIWISLAVSTLNSIL